MVRLYTGSQSAVERAAAERIAASLHSARRRSRRVSLALPGGRSIAGVLRLLVWLNVPWPDTVVLPADERCLPDDHGERNWKIIRRELLQPLMRSGAIQPHNGHPFHYRPELADWGVGEFSRSLDLPSTPEGTTHIDVAVLGAGEDGHVASLFPGSPVLTSASRGFVQISDSPKPPPRRISLSPAMIRACGSVILLFLGESKRTAARAFADNSVTAETCPAVLVRAAARAWVFADRGACPGDGNWSNATVVDRR